MTLLRSPLEAQLHRIRFWMVVVVNLAFLLYSVVTTLVGPEAVNCTTCLTAITKPAPLPHWWRWPDWPVCC